MSNLGNLFPPQYSESEVKLEICLKNHNEAVKKNEDIIRKAKEMLEQKEEFMNLLKLYRG